MTYFKISSLLFLVFGFLTLKGQPPANAIANHNANRQVIMGKLIDSETKHAVPFATVVIYNQADSSMVNGSISKENGSFFIPTKSGKFYLIIKFMGYKKKLVPNIIVSVNKPLIRVGVIQLHRSASDIKGVDIIGNQSYVDYKIDRKIVHVGRDLGSSGGTAVEALENVPSVSVDIDGNVQLRGSSSFTVLINGKPSPLNGSDALEQIPTSVIKNIEIITNPSAKYDPDGMTGIINVVLKEDVKQGLNGFAEVSLASFDSYSLNTIFNYRKNKINYFAGANLRWRNYPGGGISDLQNLGADTNLFRNTQIDRLRKRNNYTLKAGIDYYANDNNTFGVDFAYGINDFGKDYNSHIYEHTLPSSYALYTMSHNLGARKSGFFKTSLNWEHKFKRKGEKIETYLYFSRGDVGKSEDQKEVVSDENWTPNGDLVNWYQTTDNKDKVDFRAKVDYTLKLKGDRKFEAGLQSRNYRENSRFVYNSYDTTAAHWIVRPDYGNVMIFNRDILSAYTTFGGMYKKFGYQLGLRGEYTNRIIQSVGDKRAAIVNRFDLFPTIHLSQKFLKTNSVLLSYSRRIDRPSGWELGPNPIFISSNFVRLGNPKLQPEYTNNFELSYQKTIAKSFISVEAYYRTTKNKIARLQQMDSLHIVYMNYANLDRDHSAGVELMTNVQFYKWFRLNLSGSYYYYKLEGNIESGTVNKTSNNYDLRANFNFMITPLMRFQVNGFYRGPSVTAQGKMSKFFMVNSALRYDLFKRKMAVTFQLRDIFSTMKHEFETITPTFISYNSFYRQGPYFSFTVNYKINNYHQERKPNMDNRNGDGGDDI